MNVRHVFALVLLLCSAVLGGGVRADTVVQALDDPQVRMLLDVYARFRTAALAGDELAVRRLLAGSQASIIDNCLRDANCARVNGGSFQSMLRLQFDWGMYPELGASSVWQFVEGRWSERSARLAWQSTQGEPGHAQPVFLVLHLIRAAKGWKVYNTHLSRVPWAPGSRNSGEADIQHFLAQPENALLL